MTCLIESLIFEVENTNSQSPKSPKHRRRHLNRMKQMGSCPNDGPFLGTQNFGCRIILGTQKGTLILTTAQMVNPESLHARQDLDDPGSPKLRPVEKLEPKPPGHP